MVEFKVGDTVRTKVGMEYMSGKVPEGTIGKKVVNCNLENLLIRMHGAEREVSVFEFGGERVLALNSEVEKVEKEAPKFLSYSIFFSNAHYPLRFKGILESVDEEFEYYTTDEGKQIGVRKTLIQYTICEGEDNE